MKILFELYSHYTNEAALPPLTETQYDNIWNEIESNPGVNYFVLETENKIVSACILSITPSLIRGGNAYGLIEHVVTHTEYRRKGFAKALSEFALDYAWTHGCTEVMLLSGASLEGAHKLYESLDFDREKRVGFIRFRA